METSGNHHLFTNDPSKVIKKEKIHIHFSDHSATVVDIETKLSKNKGQKIVSRDMRKLRSNPGKLVVDQKWTGPSSITTRKTQMLTC